MIGSLFSSSKRSKLQIVRPKHSLPTLTEEAQHLAGIKPTASGSWGVSSTAVLQPLPLISVRTIECFSFRQLIIYFFYWNDETGKKFTVVFSFCSVYPASTRLLGLDEVVALQPRWSWGHSGDQIVHNLAMTLGRLDKMPASVPPEFLFVTKQSRTE